MQITYKGKTPQVDESAFVADNATLIGDVTIGPDASVWFGAVLRGDNGPIVVGRGSNIQDNATLHTEPQCGLTIGEYVTIGHNAVVHGAKVGDGALIGAGAVVKEGDHIPPLALAVGVPAKVIKTGTEAQKQGNVANAKGYVVRKNSYKAQN